MKKTLRSAAVLAALALAACGDNDSNDNRGYVKAPLENPGWTVEPEEASPMTELGDPIRLPEWDTAGADTSGTPSTLTPAAAEQPAAE